MPARSVVAQGGEIIRELREQTGTRIKIEDPVAHCEDRVVTIVGPDRCANKQKLVNHTEED